jgi:MFS family permease
VSAKRRGYRLTALVLLVMMLGGTLPVPLYVLYEKQMGFGPLGVTVVFAAYVIGALFALVALGDLSDHIGRKKVLAIAVACAAASTALFLRHQRDHRHHEEHRPGHVFRADDDA